MEKAFGSEYRFQFLSDVLESTMNYFPFEDEILNRCRELQKYIESIRFEEPINTDGLNLKEEFYVEVYED